ncbi:MAG TPA: SHOCT domain-containing protein, partial [Conexibacter sp.]|nr:SHOCT domain-containing protein [Conexibacter sp.]
WQWLDKAADTWRWYEDGTPSSPSVTDRTPSLTIDPKLVSPPGRAAEAIGREGIENQSVAQPPAPSAELERLGELHARGILTDEEFQQAKRRVLES